MIKTLLKSVRQYKKDSILAPIFVACEVAIECMLPLVMAELIDRMSGESFGPIIRLGISLVIMAMFSLLFGVLSGRAAASASCGFARNLRQDIFFQIQDFAFADIDHFSTSSLVTRMTTDVTNIQNAYQMIIRIAIRTPLMLIFSVLMCMTISVKMSFIFLALIPILGVVLFGIAIYTFPIFQRIFKKYDALNNSVQENVSAIRVVKSFVREDHEMKKFDKAASDVCDDFTSVEKILAINNPSYKDARVKYDPEDWLIFENTHEAIVDPETWQLAQQTKRTVHRTDTTGVANPLTGLMFCADCGAKMYNHRGKRKPGDTDFTHDAYNCSTYNLTRIRETRTCDSHHISTKAVMQLLLETLRYVSQFALTDEAGFVQKIRQTTELQQESRAKELKRKLRKDEKRCKELDTLLKKLYESYALGKLPEKRYEALSAEYEQEQADLEEAIVAGQQELDAYNVDTSRADKFLELAKKYTDFTELTTPMIYEFVDKVLVHKPEKIDGERVMEVEIYLKYIGKVEVPPPDPATIAAEEEAKRKEQQRKNHERYLRKKEKKRLAAEQAKAEDIA